MSDNSFLYFDCNASTPVADAVMSSMMPFFGTHFANPSCGHAQGALAAAAVERARAQLAALIACESDELTFSSGASESNNHVLQVLVRDAPAGRRHLVVSAIEHSVVLHTARFLAQQYDDCTLTVVPVDERGYVSAASVAAAVRDDTLLVAIMLANNETGCIQPLREIVAAVKAINDSVLVHSDAAQAVGKVPVNVRDLQVDFLAIAGHKMYAPKGIGALYVKRGVQLARWIHGAGQERGMRAGTTNVPFAVALGSAAQLALPHVTEKSLAALAALRDRLFDLLQRGAQQIDGLRVVRNSVGDHTKVLPNTLSVALIGIEASTLLNGGALSSKLMASAGAACHSGCVAKMSHVLKAMRIDEKQAIGTLRLSLSRKTTQAEVERASELILQEAKKILSKNGGKSE